MFTALNRTADASEEPVSLSEAKAHLRVTSTDEDSLITSLVKAARIACEEYTSRSFVTQTWVAEFRGLIRGDELHLPRPLVINVSSVQYKNSLGVLTTVLQSDYEVNSTSEPGIVRFKNIPAFDTQYQNPLRVEYTAGFGSASTVPEDIKLAIKFTVSAWWTNRSGEDLPSGVKAMLSQYRIQYLT